MATIQRPVGQAAAVLPAEEPGGWLSWLTTVDHKKIGIMYLVVSFFFFIIGGIEALLMRVQLGAPNNTFLSPEAYNQIFTMHATTMIFLGIMPLNVGFGNYLVPIMIGARDMAYPRLNALIFDEALVIRETFLRRIPPLVLVGAYDTIPDDLRVLYHHPATTPLLPETGLSFQPTELVSSNSVACKLLLDSPDDSLAITNQLCSDHYGLHIFKVLRPGTLMPWVVFGRAESYTPAPLDEYPAIIQKQEDCCEEDTFLAAVQR